MEEAIPEEEELLIMNELRSSFALQHLDGKREKEAKTVCRFYRFGKEYERVNLKENYY